MKALCSVCIHMDVSSDASTLCRHFNFPSTIIISPPTHIHFVAFVLICYTLVYINLLHCDMHACIKFTIHNARTHAIRICVWTWAICKQRLIETLLFNVHPNEYNRDLLNRICSAITIYAFVSQCLATATWQWPVDENETYTHTHTLPHYIKHFTFPGICNRSFSTLINWSKHF